MAVAEGLRRRPQVATASAGLLMLVVAVAIGPGSARTFWPAWLLAHSFWLHLALGALLAWLVHALTGGGWGQETRRHWRAATGALPLLALFAVPLAFGLESLFPWAGESRAEVTWHGHQQVWLQPGWHRLRLALILIAWLCVAAAAGAFTRDDDPRPARRAATIGLLVLAATITLWCVDWLLALQMTGNTTMIGFTTMAGQFAGGIALGMLAERVRVGASPTDDDRRRLQDLGNLLLAAISFHAYVFYMDFLIVWQGNLPHEVHWYLARADGGGRAVALALVATHLVVPFVILLSRSAKRSPRVVVWAAISVLVGRMLHAVWDVLPAVERGRLLPTAGIALLLAAGIGTILLAGLLARRGEEGGT
ncbi:MAG: hypothetical protein R3323_02025 [Wenzhouxiangellaceae bacterium]|nr:hypothetical protein [Wenzhouxiangellaceae bacterium]